MKDNDPMASRFKASNSYTRINLDAFRIQRAGSSNKLFLIVRGSGQIATAPLVVAEQFNLGGPDSVRGYMQSEVLGDSGYSASAELRISMGKNIQGALFVDHGTAYLNKPLPSERAITSLTGAGVGARMKVGKEGSVRLDWGFPLTPKPNFLNRASMVYGQFSIRF
jgi:hemolysin activation/secretion protein